MFEFWIEAVSDSETSGNVVFVLAYTHTCLAEIGVVDSRAVIVMLVIH